MGGFKIGVYFKNVILKIQTRDNGEDFISPLIGTKTRMVFFEDDLKEAAAKRRMCDFGKALAEKLDQPPLTSAAPCRFVITDVKKGFGAFLRDSCTLELLIRRHSGTPVDVGVTKEGKLKTGSDFKLTFETPAQVAVHEVNLGVQF